MSTIKTLPATHLPLWMVWIHQDGLDPDLDCQRLQAGEGVNLFENLWARRRFAHRFVLPLRQGIV